METKSIERLNTLHPKIRQKALDAYAESCKLTPNNVHPYITETTRSFERSEQLFNQPFDHKDNDGDGKIDESDEKVSNSHGGASYHNYSLAVDFMLIINGKDSWNVDANWKLVASIFKKHGFTWGGDWTGGFKDYPHVEMRLGYTTSQLLAKYKAGLFIPGTKYLIL